MAQGDVTFFQVALKKMIAGDWASTDHFYLAICDNTAAPSASTTTPTLGDFTEVGTSGTYSSGGTDLGTLDAITSQSGAVLTIDSTTNPTWAQDASNDADAYWGIVYNYTDAGNDAMCFVDLGGPVDMTAGDLTVTWNASGIVTITIS